MSFGELLSWEQDPSLYPGKAGLLQVSSVFALCSTLWVSANYWLAQLEWVSLFCWLAPKT